MAGMSNYLEGQVFTHIFGTASFTKPAALAVALTTVAPTDTSTGATITEVGNSNNYSRVSLNPDDANWTVSSGSASNAVEIAFPQASGSWGTVTHVVILDSATHGAGNVMFYGSLSVSKAVTSGDVVKIPIGSLALTLD